MKTTFFAIMFTALVSSGCSKDYSHAEVGADSPMGRQAAGMLDALRQAGAAGLDQVIANDGAPGLDAAQQQALRAVLEQMISADEATLTDVDRFGEVYRASVQLVANGQPQEIYVLMVLVEKNLKWAGGH